MDAICSLQRQVDGNVLKSMEVRSPKAHVHQKPYLWKKTDTKPAQLCGGRFEFFVKSSRFCGVLNDTASKKTNKKVVFCKQES